ncbi:ABC transporter substrate-binding protein [Streptomyces sp. NPDC054784]
MTARRRSTQVTALAAAAVACVSLLSGCGALPGTAEADDDGIAVMTWAPEGTRATDVPGMPAMAQAFARWVNAEGGIHGRRLEVFTCNDHNESVGAARCAARAVEEDVVAVVGSYSQHGRSFMSPLEGAAIPYLGGYGLTEEEFTSPLSYPVNGGLPALVAGNGQQLAAGRCDRVALVRPDNVGGDQLPRLLDAGLRGGGAAAAVPAADVRAPEDATSYRDAARQALEGSATGAAGGGRSCVTAMLGGRTGTFFDSFRRLVDADAPVRTASVVGGVQQSLVDRTGGSASPLEGTYATGWYPAGSDGRWDTMRKVVREHAFGDNRIDTDDPGVQTTWVAYTALRAALESLDDDEAATADTVRDALDNGGAIRTGGLTPPLRWHYEDLLAAHDFPRIVNTSVTYQRVDAGRLAPVRDGFVDVERTLEGGAADL